MRPSLLFRWQRWFFALFASLLSLVARRTFSIAGVLLTCGFWSLPMAFNETSPVTGPAAWAAALVAESAIPTIPLLVIRMLSTYAWSWVKQTSS